MLLNDCSTFLAVLAVSIYWFKTHLANSSDWRHGPVELATVDLRNLIIPVSLMINLSRSLVCYRDHLLEFIQHANRLCSGCLKIGFELLTVLLVYFLNSLLEVFYCDVF